MIYNKSLKRKKPFCIIPCETGYVTAENVARIRDILSCPVEEIKDIHTPFANGVLFLLPIMHSPKTNYSVCTLFRMPKTKTGYCYAETILFVKNKRCPVRIFKYTASRTVLLNGINKGITNNKMFTLTVTFRYPRKHVYLKQDIVFCTKNFSN